MAKFRLILLILLPLLQWSNAKATLADLPRGELKPGRYIGWIQNDGRAERIALIADFYFESSDSLKDFPRLTASFKLSLGGYNTHEYITETFNDLKYDFDNGNLTFDEPQNDFLLTTKVYKEKGRAKILGQILIRSSSTIVNVELLEESDEPEDESEALSPSRLTEGELVPFIPLLDGQYEGICDGKEAMLQIQTVRGLLSEEVVKAVGLEQAYGISGRLALKKDRFCGKLPKDKWCTKLHFTSGSYNIYQGRLSLKGEQGSQQCDVNGDAITCQFPMFDSLMTCDLKRPSESVPDANFFQRRFHLRPTDEQSETLPPPAPPQNQALSSALQGAFYGYAHNEVNDTYLPIRLDVVPYVSTDNPHNPNQMMIASSASIFLGGFQSESVATQRYEARSFYLEPGFTLSGPSADSFISITEWKKGFIRGIWYSHGFGRVGTIQLIKGAPMQAPKDVNLVQDFAGEYKYDLKNGRFSQWVKFNFPVQPNESHMNTIQMSGSYQTVVGTSGLREIENGVFDLYTGKIGWLISHGGVSTFGNGNIAEDGAARIFLPPLPMAGAITRSYSFERFERMK